MPPKKTKEKIEWSYNNQEVTSVEQFPEGAYGFTYR